MPTRPVALTPRLYDPYSDLTGAPASRGGGQVIAMESCGWYSQPHEQLRTRPGEGVSIRMVQQPGTRPISPGQLMAEVKGILAGLLMVEAKYPGVHAKQTAACHCGHQPKLNNEQLQALTSLHHTLLDEHHDSFLASQLPSAGPSFRRSAPKYPAPARLQCRQRGRNQGRCWSKGHNRKINRGKWNCGR